MIGFVRCAMQRATQAKSEINIFLFLLIIFFGDECAHSSSCVTTVRAPTEIGTPHQSLDNVRKKRKKNMSGQNLGLSRRERCFKRPEKRPALGVRYHRSSAWRLIRGRLLVTTVFFLAPGRWTPRHTTIWESAWTLWGKRRPRSAASRRRSSCSHSWPIPDRTRRACSYKQGMPTAPAPFATS